jgi:hypothetical protein
VRTIAGADFCPRGVPTTELPADCHEAAATPGELFAKLDEWGHASIVIPHGTAWGLYTPPGSGWRKQLTGADHDPERQTLVEVMSGHGNSEEYRDYRAVHIAADGTRSCPPETAEHLPSCQRAGQLIRERCLAAGESEAECEQRAEKAREDYVEAESVYGHTVVPGARPEDWLDSGQCRDCYVPSFNCRPLGSVQAMLALRNFSGDGGPERFRFGFLAASDNHSARPGTGYKEYGRLEMTDTRFSRSVLSEILPEGDPPEPVPYSVPYAGGAAFARDNESERTASFFYPGGLVAVHAEGRDRRAIWQALERREVYGTSGPRILLWFDLLNGSGGRELAMGAQSTQRSAPIFQARAVGSLEQLPGCAARAGEALGAERLARLCAGECYRPSERRRLVTRIEVVRIRPQQREDEALGPLIEDPWRVFACDPDPEGCVVTFSDPDFEGAARDAVYYVRAIEAPSPHINADPLRCERDAEGRCLATRECGADPSDECYDEAEERAWSSPIFVDYGVAGERAQHPALPWRSELDTEIFLEPRVVLGVTQISAHAYPVLGRQSLPRCHQPLGIGADGPAQLMGVAGDGLPYDFRDHFRLHGPFETGRKHLAVAAHDGLIR